MAFRPPRRPSMSSLSAKARSRLYSNLEKYARSGMGMERACDSLLAQPRLAAAERRIYEGIKRGLARGLSIGESLGESAAEVRPLEREVIVAAEQGGRLDQGFAHLAEYYRRADRTRRLVTKGLAYPLILLHVAIPVSTLAVTAFQQLEATLGSGGAVGAGAASAYTAAFLAAGRWVLLGYAATALLGLAAVLLLRLGRRSEFADGLLRRVPLLGRARRAVAMERFSQVFEIFLLAGRTMSESLAGAGAASGSGRVRRASERGASAIRDGGTLSQALFAARGAFPDDFARGVAAAEEGGQLDREFALWGRHYAEEAAEAMERLGEWAPRLFYWGVLLFVAALVIRIALAYRDLLTGAALGM